MHMHMPGPPMSMPSPMPGPPMSMPSPMPGPPMQMPMQMPPPMTPMTPMPGAMHPGLPYGHRPPPARSRANLILVGGALLVLVAAAIASIVLSATGG
jgi:hypothetical protein